MAAAADHQTFYTDEYRHAVDSVKQSAYYCFAEMFESMFRKTTGNWLELGLDRHDLAVLALGALLMLMVGIVRERGICIRERIASWPMVRRWTVYAWVFCAIVLLGAYGSGYGVVDPLYANF